MKTSENTANLLKALLEAQKEFPVIEFDMSNDYIGYEYASFKAVVNGTKPVLTKNGLVIVQTITERDMSVGVTTRLAHAESGEFIEDTIVLPVPEKKGMTLAQVAGATVTYFKRYAWSAMLGLVTDKDTDGQLDVATTVIAKENKKANDAVKKALEERIWSLDAMELVIKADIGIKDHEGAMSILNLSVLPDTAPTKTIESWLNHFINANASDNVGCAQEANNAYTQAKKNGGKK